MGVYNTPDGPVNFPDTMSDEQVRDVLRKKYPPTAPAAPAPAPGGPEPGFQFGEMVGNIPSSAAGVAGDIWQAVSNPIDTGKAVVQAGMGGIQHVQDMLPESVQWMAPPVEGDYRPQASAVADALKERYGGGEEILNTLETDPVGAVSDVAGALSFKTPATVAKYNPVTRALSGAADRTAQNTMASANKFSTVIPEADRAAMTNTMLEQGINPSPRGVQKLDKLIQNQGKVVDDLILAADAGGGTIPIGQVLRQLDRVKQERGASLVGGGQDIAAIDNFIQEVVGNARRLGKRDLNATDLQKLKRDLYDQIAWNAKRQVDEVPALEETKKVTARAAKEQIEQLAPGTKEANNFFGDLLELKPNLERASSRISNRDTFGMTDMFSVGTGGGLGLATNNPVLGASIFGLMEMFNNPKISPTVAQGIYRMGKGVGSPGAQTATSIPYFGGSLYYAGERGALEDEEEE